MASIMTNNEANNILFDKSENILKTQSDVKFKIRKVSHFQKSLPVPEENEMKNNG